MEYNFNGTLGSPALSLEEDGGTGHVTVYVPWIEVVHMLDYLIDGRYVNLDYQPELRNEINELRHKMDKQFEYYDRVAEMEKHISERYMGNRKYNF